LLYSFYCVVGADFNLRHQDGFVLNNKTQTNQQSRPKKQCKKRKENTRQKGEITNGTFFL
jgi:hypothetical protein